VTAANTTVVTQEVSTLEMLSSATSAVGDVASFCVRQPDVCETAAYVAGKLEAKAKYSAKLIYEWASESTSDPALPATTQEAIKVDMMSTGSVKLAKADPPEQKNQSTLQIEDLIPEWRGPVEKAKEKKEG
jgi:hypothetical protein